MEKQTNPNSPSKRLIPLNQVSGEFLELVQACAKSGCYKCRGSGIQGMRAHMALVCICCIAEIRQSLAWMKEEEGRLEEGLPPRTATINENGLLEGQSLVDIVPPHSDHVNLVQSTAAPENSGTERVANEP